MSLSYLHIYEFVLTGEDTMGNSDDDERKEVVNIEVWLKKPDIKYACKCQEVIGNGYMFPRSVSATVFRNFAFFHQYVLKYKCYSCGRGNSPRLNLAQCLICLDSSVFLFNNDKEKMAQS